MVAQHTGEVDAPGRPAAHRPFDAQVVLDRVRRLHVGAGGEAQGQLLGEDKDIALPAVF